MQCRDDLMPSYDFEVWQGDRALHELRGVQLENPRRAWDHVARLANAFDLPKGHIAVKDEDGAIAILVGAKTAKMLAAQPAQL